MTTMREGLVSTIIAVYNRPQLVTDAVNSVLAQIIYSNDNGNSALNGYDMARAVYGKAGNTGNTVPYISTIEAGSSAA